MEQTNTQPPDNDPTENRVLAVDDTPEHLSVLTNILEANGYTALVANNGPLALKIAEKSLPSLILLDSIMPEMDGYEVCDRLKANPTLRDIPVIFISGKTETLDKVKAFQMGAVDYITKPFQTDEILARINTHVTLRRTQKQLEQRSTELQHSLTALKEAQDQLLKQKSALRHLLENLAHDVRTPLASLKLGMGRLLAQSPNNPEVGAAMRAEVQYLDAMFANVAVMLSIEAAAYPLTLSLTNISQTVENAVLRFSILAQDKNIALNYSVPDKTVFAQVDPVALEQALGNLVQNAIKFCQQNVAILLTAQNEGFAVQVKDDGRGLVDAEIEQLTRRYFQGAHRLDRGRSGLGLGLAIVQEIVDRHHGTFTMSNEPEGGCCAHISLPYGNSA